MSTTDKKQLLDALTGFTEISDEDALKVCTLRDAFPYSQALQALVARVSKDRKMNSHEDNLQMAAVYSADRSVLKDVMTRTPQVWPSSLEVSGQQHVAMPTSLENGVEVPPVQVSTSAEDLADKVMRDLRKLNLARHNFENMMEESSLGITEPTSETESNLESGDEEETLERKRKLPPGRKPGNEKAHRIVELVKALENEEINGLIQHENGGEEILESIKTSKKKISPESEKQREQIQIIEEFIRVQPSISPAKNRVSDGRDDFNTTKNGEFGDNVISETLVDILIQQGKKEKAVEVLKKLIWKFPQKKSYFAAQIEELKK